MSEEQNLTFSGPSSIGALFVRHAAKQPEANAIALTPTVSDGGAHGKRQMTAAASWHAATRTNAQSPPNLEVALALAARGLCVFPIREDDTNVDPDSLKQPVIEKWQIYATTNEKQSCRLTLTLLDSKSLEIFRALCHDLLSATAKLPRGDNGTGLLVVLARLYEWQGLLKRRYEKVLSTQEIIGLFGELLFLRDCLTPVLGLDAPSSWRGSFREEQDFVIGNSIIEVKTQLSTADQRIFISSEAQLDTSSGNILLCHQTLGASTAHNSSSRSLNGIVDEIAALLGPAESPPGLEFQLGLLKADYTRRSEYDERHWVLASRKLFSVEDGFPRITPATVAQGIERVAYQIRVEACVPFETDLDKAMEHVVGKRI